MQFSLAKSGLLLVGDKVCENVTVYVYCIY